MMPGLAAMMESMMTLIAGGRPFCVVALPECSCFQPLASWRWIVRVALRRTICIAAGHESAHLGPCVGSLA